jgi:inosine-uridine nucleoside N-ribohydrolase
VAETPDKETQGDKHPEAAQQGASSRVPAIVVSLSALAVIGAATANSLPNFNSFSLPNFDHFSLPNFNRFAAQPHTPHKTASAPIPDPAVSATLKDIQLSQQQNAAVLVSLTQSFATQQADLREISRQLSSLAAQADALQSAVTPLTTSSISHSNTRARVVRTSRKIVSPLPKPFGPVSVGGAPLSPAPVPGSGAG